MVPLYNEGTKVQTLVGQLLSLHGFDRFVLVDASDDATSRAQFAKLAQNPEFLNRIWFVNAKVPGRARQMNQGADICDEDILLFLHCDTQLPQQAANLIDKAMDDECLWGRFDVRLSSRDRIFRIVETMINVRSRLRQLATGDQAMFVRRAVFNQVGGFPKIDLMEDIGMSKKLSRHGKPGLITQPVVTSARRWQNGGPIKTIFLMWRLRFLFWIGANPRTLANMYQHER